MSDFFEHENRFAHNYAARPVRAQFLDALYDLRLRMDRRLPSLRRGGSSLPAQRVLVVGVEVPARAGALHEITRQLAQSRHDVEVSTVPMLPRGKFENVDAAIAAAKQPLDAYDWLVITDDDVWLPRNFLDDYISIASAAGLVISQPAHRFKSHTTYQITRRRFGTIARRTGFVEIGPLTVLRSQAFAKLIPFPPSRWSYGLDVIWADVSAREGWLIGIVDALAIGHLRPIAATYDMSEAIEEGRSLLKSHGVSLKREAALQDHGELF